MKNGLPLSSEKRNFAMKTKKKPLIFQTQILNQISSGIIVYDKEWRFVYLNNSASKILKKKPSQLIGKIVWDAFPEFSDTELGQKFIEASKKNKAIFLQTFYPPFQKWFEVRIYPGKDGLTTSFRDITESKKIEESLRISEEKFRAAFYHTAIAISLSDMQANWIEFNKAYPKMFGYSAKELKTMHPALFIHPEDIEKSIEAFHKLIHGDIPVLVQERRYVRKDRVIVYGIVNATVVKDKNGKPLYVITAIEDITQRKLLEQQKDEFLGTASHELKTPVTSLKVFTQALQKKFIKEGNERSAHMLGKMDSQINKLIHLIQDLLDINLAGSGRLKLHKQTFRIDEYVQTLVEEFQPTAKSHHIILKGSTGKTIHADQGRIGQVITNLLTNAVKYSPEGKQIIVSLKSTKHSATISVTDFGIGMEKKDIPHIFERFYRVKGEWHNTVPGMGIGLNIAAEIIKRHKGRIWVESEKGKGSTFYVTLPANS